MNAVGRRYFASSFTQISDDSFSNIFARFSIVAGVTIAFLQSLQISANSKEQAEKIAEELQQLEGIRNIVSSANLNPYEVFIKFLYGDYGKIY